MAKKTLKGTTTLACSLDKVNRTYNCEMSKLEQEKKAKGIMSGEWTIPKLDMHRWNTEGIKFFSNVKISPPAGFLSRAGGNFGALFPSGSYLECKTGVKLGKLDTTECTLKREDEF